MVNQSKTVVEPFTGKRYNLSKLRSKKAKPSSRYFLCLVDNATHNPTYRANLNDVYFPASSWAVYSKNQNGYKWASERLPID